MPQITKSMLLTMFLGVVMFAVAGCGTPNDKAVLDSDSGQHSAGWLPAKHAEAGKADMATCAECHEGVTDGGISGVSCTGCHLGGADSVHPKEWSGVTVTTHSTFVSANGNTSCSNVYCHGADLSGVVESGPSCSSCHLGGPMSAHPADWGAYGYYKHSVYTNSTGTAGCATATCHGADLTGVAGLGPSCTKCHMGGIYSVHPAEWSADITLHKDYVASKGSSQCANAVCHGTKLTGVQFSGPSCYVCH